MHLGTEGEASFKIFMSQYVSQLIGEQEQHTKQPQSSKVYLGNKEDF
jgi:hypothetical protein